MSNRISVVIPTRNRAHLLGTTLDCVLTQSLAPAEVIVVDDGSTDGTAALLTGYVDRPIRDISFRHISVQHGGHLIARNIGLRAARHDLVAFCDSDDLWQPAFLETVSALWQRAPDLTVSYSNFAIVREGAWSRSTKFQEAPDGFWDGIHWLGRDLGRINQCLAERLIDFQPFFPTGMAVNRNRFIALGGWDDGVDRVIGSDFATALRAVAQPPIGIIQQPLVGIRKHADNLSGNTERMNLGNARVLEHVLATRPALAALASKIQVSVGNRRRDALDAAFVRQDMAEVRRIFRLLPPDCCTPMTRVKATLAALPSPLATRINRLALSLGSSKAAFLAKTAAQPWASAGQPHADRGGSHRDFSSAMSP